MPLSGPPLANPVPIHRILDAALATKPDEAGLASVDGRLAWRAFEATAQRLAANYLRLGLRPGDRLASLMPNRKALLVHYLACMKAGLVAVPLNYRYTAPEIDHALTVSGAAALLAHADRDADLAASAAVPRLPFGVIAFAAAGRSPSYEALAAAEPAPMALPTPAPTDPAAIFFTSGSTGAAKGVTHSQGSLAAMFAACAEGFELCADDILLPGSSMSHIGGFLFAFAALSRGARVLVAKSYDGEGILPLLRSERPTVLCMIPAALFTVIRDGHARREDFASLRLTRSGSDKVPQELEEEFTALTGLVIDEGYGCTEAGLVTLSPPSGRIVAGSIGRALAGFDLSVRDDAGAELGPGSDGNLWIRGASLMTGYWGDPAATAAVFRDGWFDSGDRMSYDDDGYLWFHGRKKQIIVHDGSNIFPQEVEEALLAHPAVAAAGVIGIRDVMHGEDVRAYVVVKPDVPPPSGGELILFARRRVGYKAPEQIVFLDEMPLNPTGKVDRVALKRIAAESHGAGN
jgi:long-chain acyl-CoA synthetase